MTRARPIATRLGNKVDFNGANGCWNFLGGLQPEGYGRIYHGQTYTYAHRAMFEQVLGPIPEGKVLDHLCRNRRCVNPDHLEPVSDAVNVSRGESPSARSVRSNWCSNGHEYTAENTYIWRDSRRCRACRRAVYTTKPRGNAS